MHQFWHGEKTLSGRRCSNRLWYHRRTFSLHLCTGFHCFCRFSVRNNVSENLQSNGSSHENGCSLYRYQWLGWRTYSRRYQCAGRLCWNFPTQYSCFRCYSTDFRYFRSLCRRSCLLSCADRLHIDDGRHIIHVPYRTESGKDCYRWRCKPRKLRWCKRSFYQIRCYSFYCQDGRRRVSHDPQIVKLYSSK